MLKTLERSGRLLYLDFLRGYFVLVIIIDHLSRFPSAWQLLTGQGLLWATAAEGFVMISGLMIGYVRGYKGLKIKFSVIAAKLLKRSVVLYVWMVIGSLGYVAVTWKLANRRDMPWYDAPVGDWPTVIHQVVTMQLPHVWVHFLYLYAIFLALSIPAVWLLRRKQPWVVTCLSLTGYILGYTHNTEWLRVQVIFFIPVIIGFYLPTFRAWWNTIRYRRMLETTVFYAAALTLLVSSVYVFGKDIPGSSVVNGLFEVSVFSIARILVSFLWFSALVLLFKRITPWLERHGVGILHYFGTHSLTAYIAHGLILCGISLVIPSKDNFFINTFAGLLAILGVYYFIRLPVIRHLLPR